MSDITRSSTVTPIARGGWLDGLRIAVALMIVLYHFRSAAPVPLDQIHPVFDRGYLLTNFFIIDSGYVLGRIYYRRLIDGRTSAGLYIRQRFLRVVPAHLVVMIAFAGLVLGTAAIGMTPSNPYWFAWSAYPAQFFLVQAYGVPGGHGWNAPTWTLSALLGCYLLLPGLLRLAHRLPPWALLIGAAVLALAANAATQAFLGYPVYRMPLGYGILRALPLFILGVAMAAFAARVPVRPRLGATLGLVSVAALAGFQAVGEFAIPSLALICAIIFTAGAIPVVKSVKLVETLALASFSIFLTNELVRIIWFAAFDAAGQAQWSDTVRWIVWGLGLGAAVAGAIVFRQAFDRPSQAWFTARLSSGPLGRSLPKDPPPAL
ncbi:MAG: acyltransferase [Brevundimonas sp.]|uniref:acyltransferase family protein n=1 Tax=Brevundimonas sp. TaxID=1871086 RepID=UPI00263159D0|nr:acyltransferase [Brevundimonas sp.]MDI6623233.1 acyltransferase [Brevundimonas sp.]MDQ7811392.1 acyltransferase [Brevundimonas sp.]